MDGAICRFGDCYVLLHFVGNERCVFLLSFIGGNVAKLGDSDRGVFADDFIHQNPHVDYPPIGDRRFVSRV